jgi:hypothetical protein
VFSYPFPKVTYYISKHYEIVVNIIFGYAEIIFLNHLQITYDKLAEGVGFEPTGLSSCGFQDRRHRPLGHPSKTAINNEQWTIKNYG